VPRLGDRDRGYHFEADGERGAVVGVVTAALPYWAIRSAAGRARPAQPEAGRA
jgi:hypothetical protein